jgi:hypothetical protein|tara:strand:+ start:595 stop:918 length:324 start_codon:yes stop_codon:yes gene_type:complete
MASLYTKVKLYIEANSTTWDDTKVFLQNDSDGKGDYIKSWTYSFSKPTDSQLASYETAGNTEESNNAVRATRKKLYGDIGDQLDEIYTNIDAWKARIKKIKEDNPKG